jgi:hypothetical protein
MQQMQPCRRLRFMRTVVASARLDGGKRMNARLQDGDSREFQQKINLRSIELTLLWRDVDAHAATMKFARTVVWTALLVRVIAMLATTDWLRRRAGNHSVKVLKVLRTKPATAPKTVSDKGRSRHDGQELVKHGHESTSPRLVPA